MQAETLANSRRVFVSQERLGVFSDELRLDDLAGSAIDVLQLSELSGYGIPDSSLPDSCSCRVKDSLASPLPYLIGRLRNATALRQPLTQASKLTCLFTDGGPRLADLGLQIVSAIEHRRLLSHRDAKLLGLLSDAHVEIDLFQRFLASIGAMLSPFKRSLAVLISFFCRARAQCNSLRPFLMVISLLFLAAPVLPSPQRSAQGGVRRS